jgi:plasmid stabilization system protein ParE
MIYSIEWKPIATNTYFDEIDFILSKWNEVEVQKFEDLVYRFLTSLSKTPKIGIYKTKYNCYSLVISKQTTLYYKIIENKAQIDLILFWNNKQNPTVLKAMLQESH